MIQQVVRFIDKHERWPGLLGGRAVDVLKDRGEPFGFVARRDIRNPDTQQPVGQFLDLCVGQRLNGAAKRLDDPAYSSFGSITATCRSSIASTLRISSSLVA